MHKIVLERERERERDGDMLRAKIFTSKYIVSI